MLSFFQVIPDSTTVYAKKGVYQEGVMYAMQGKVFLKVRSGYVRVVRAPNGKDLATQTGYTIHATAAVTLKPYQFDSFGFLTA